MIPGDVKPNRASRPSRLESGAKDWYTPADTWTKYTGTYFEPFTFKRVVVTVENNQLVAELVDTNPGTKLTLRQLAGDTFIVPELGVYLTFWFEDDPTAARYAITRLGVFTRVE